jgi:hypothetical protein
VRRPDNGPGQKYEWLWRCEVRYTIRMGMAIG